MKRPNVRPEWHQFEFLYPLHPAWGKRRWQQYFEAQGSHVPTQTIAGWLRIKRRGFDHVPKTGQVAETKARKARALDLIQQYWPRYAHWANAQWRRWLSEEHAIVISDSGVSRWMEELTDRDLIRRPRRVSPRLKPRINQVAVHTCAIHMDDTIIHVAHDDLLQQLASTWRKLQDWLGAAWGGNWEASHWAPPDERAVFRLKMLPTVDSYFEPIASLRKWDCCWEYYAFGSEDYNTHHPSQIPSIPDQPVPSGLNQREYKQYCLDLLARHWEEGMTQDQWVEVLNKRGLNVSRFTVSRLLKQLHSQDRIAHYDGRWDRYTKP